MNLGKEEKEKHIEEGLERIKLFTWEKCAEEVLEVLEK